MVNGCGHIPASQWSEVLRAMMEISAFSPYHSSGLCGLEPLQVWKRRSDRFAIISANNLRNFDSFFQAAPSGGGRCAVLFGARE
jgi:hypothetical protein